MEKYLKKMKADIINDYNSLEKANDIKTLEVISNHFKPTLSEFYDKLSLYLAYRYEKEQNKSIEYEYNIDYFYRNITRFGYNHLYTNEIKKVNTKNPIIDNLVYNVRKKISNDFTVYHTEQKCGIASAYLQNIAKENNDIKSYIITTNAGFGMHVNPHAFNILEYKNKLFLIDCTYSQFTKLFQMSEKIMKLPTQGSAAEPIFYLLKSREGINLADEILTNGFFEVTPKKFKLYMDSFLLSNRNAFCYLNYPELNPYKSEISEEYYINHLKEMIKRIKRKRKEGTTFILKCFETYPYEIPDIYKIVEFDYDKGPNYLDEESLKNIDEILQKNR